MLWELVRVLPLDTWLSAISLQEGAVTITGFSGSASEIQRLIEESPLFEDAEFASPLPVMTPGATASPCVSVLAVSREAGDTTARPSSASPAGRFAGSVFRLIRSRFPAYNRLAAAVDIALEREDQLRRYRRAVARKADYGQLLEEARRRVEEGEALLLRGDNSRWPPAELQAVIEEVAEATGIELGQRNMSAARQKDEFS